MMPPLTLSFGEGAALVCGSGRVGAGITHLLARGGVPVVFTYHSDAERAKTVERTLKDEGANVQAVQIDLSDVATIDRAIEAAITLGGGLGPVFSAGGPMMPFAKLSEIDSEALSRFLVADAVGAHNLVARTIPELRKHGGSITFCTTVANYRVVTYDGASPFSKGAVEALMRQIASEEACYGIRANSVGVSWVSDRSYAEQAEDVAQVPEPELSHIHSILNQLSEETPLGRPARSEEAAWLFAFLASEQAGYITGQSIQFDGGFSLGGVPLKRPG
ncbi:SDR family NAD(P)-dependent oxidoreductase [Croceicoccus estronivorus]|uniref:SDR family NAD(P)-dependent oxidoreductase n=1 Tax=Croceicoccus estronivorus TaxID=1172626 RepID=UPI0009EEF79F|nr:SDR family oxidoreductase [Croceicoccus estronivorus]